MSDRFDVTSGSLYDPDDDKELLESLNSPLADKNFIRT